jgi:predicted dehydrogenase
VANNGTHEIDMARWALGMDYPVRVTSVGGRYHYDDDWEFYDTQDVGYDFPGKKTIVWQGRSANGFPILNRGRGTSIHGTGGSIVLDRDGYLVYDPKNKVMKDVSGEEKTDALKTRGGDKMTDRHIANFIRGIRVGEKLNSPIQEGHVSSDADSSRQHRAAHRRYTEDRAQERPHSWQRRGSKALESRVRTRLGTLPLTQKRHPNQRNP